MKKVITYGTFDLLHHGHIRLLERAKALGDYLIVAVTSDDFDRKRGKINVSQTLIERIQAVKKTGLADEIIVEEYEGQKIDDIINYGVDVFTVGSDWEGTFDYLKEYCEVIYLPRTKGVSSSEIRTSTRKLKLGLVGYSINNIKKVIDDSEYVNGLDIAGIYLQNSETIKEFNCYNTYEELLKNVDAVYLSSHPFNHYDEIKRALSLNKHVICETPIALSNEQVKELFDLAEKNKLVLMDSIKTAYLTAYSRLLLLLKCGVIGDVVSVDSTCTSLKVLEDDSDKLKNTWPSICSWGPTAMLPIFQIFGLDYKDKRINTLYLDKEKTFDIFTKIDFTYKNAVASIKVGKGVKSEGELIISGTKGYIYVPSPWWKTDYFEIRYENMTDNKKYFYELDGEGYRNELAIFVRSINEKKYNNIISKEISYKICDIIGDFNNKVDTNEI